MKTMPCRYHVILLIILLSAAIRGENPVVVPADSVPAFSQANVKSCLDSLLPALLKRYNIAGCGLVLVKDSSVFFEQGYGYADLQSKKKVEPKTTLFRTASVCKTVLATALMQLKERGLIDFNKDVNHYLKEFKVPQKFGTPLTAAHLLTHTPGFDDFYIGKSSMSEKEAPALKEFLKKHMPDRIIPPGEVFMYSNMGMALAALLVEDITGKEYENYVRDNIFAPLGMRSASFRTGPEALKSLYHGYVYLNGRQLEFPFDFINDYPAGQMLTTVDDFAAFMIMHLNNGMYKGMQVISPSSIEEMQTPRFSHYSMLHSAIGYGFFIDDYNGKRMLYHDGGYPGIMTQMKLFPEYHLGVFIAVNGSFPVVTAMVTDALMKRFFPERKTGTASVFPIKNLPHYNRDVNRFTGYYRYARYSRNEISKIGMLTGMTGVEIPIWKNDQGMLMMYDLAGKPRRLIQVEPLIFRSIDDDYIMKFRADGSGAITHLFTDGTSSFEKVPALNTFHAQRMIFSVIIIVFISVAITSFIRTKKLKREKNSAPKSQLFRSAVLTANLFLFYMLAMGLTMKLFMSPLEQLVGMPYGAPWYMYVIQTIPFLIIMSILYQIWNLYQSVTRKKTSLKGIAVYSMYLMLCLALILSMNYWNLIGYRF